MLHCAASIAFDLPLDEARKINVEGTREVIGFARECRSLGRLERFVHVSTAFVSGRHGGRFGEDDLIAGQSFRNTYEQTKWEAEHVVAGADDLAPAIARPSIVMGEAASGWTPAFNVLYWPLRAFSRGLFDEVPALAHSRVDVVPVDYVADALVHLLDTDDEGVFNLVAGDDACTADQLMKMACDRFEKPVPPVVAPGSAADDSAGDHGAVYLPYFDMEVVFDDSRARDVLEPGGRPRAAADRLLRAPDRLRGGRPLGQAVDDARGGARAHPRAGGGRRLTGSLHALQVCRSASSGEWSLRPPSRQRVVVDGGGDGELGRREDVVEPPAAAVLPDPRGRRAPRGRGPRGTRRRSRARAARARRRARPRPSARRAPRAGARASRARTRARCRRPARAAAC